MVYDTVGVACTCLLPLDLAVSGAECVGGVGVGQPVGGGGERTVLAATADVVLQRLLGTPGGWGRMQC